MAVRKKRGHEDQGHCSRPKALWIAMLVAMAMVMVVLRVKKKKKKMMMMLMAIHRLLTPVRMLQPRKDPRGTQ